MAWNIHSDANRFGWDNTTSALAVQEKRRWCQQPTLCHTGPAPPKQLNNGCDITVLNTTKTAKAWWVNERTQLAFCPLWSAVEKEEKPDLHHGCDLRKEGLLRRPHGKSSLDEVRKLRESFFEHAKRNLLWNTIHVHKKTRHNCCFHEIYCRDEWCIKREQQKRHA